MDCYNAQGFTSKENYLRIERTEFEVGKPLKIKLKGDFFENEYEIAITNDGITIAAFKLFNNKTTTSAAQPCSNTTRSEVINTILCLKTFNPDLLLNLIEKGAIHVSRLNLISPACPHASSDLLIRYTLNHDKTADNKHFITFIKSLPLRYRADPSMQPEPLDVLYGRLFKTQSQNAIFIHLVNSLNDAQLKMIVIELTDGRGEIPQHTAILRSIPAYRLATILSDFEAPDILTILTSLDYLYSSEGLQILTSLTEEKSLNVISRCQHNQKSLEKILFPTESFEEHYLSGIRFSVFEKIIIASDNIDIYKKYGLQAPPYLTCTLLQIPPQDAAKILFNLSPETAARVSVLIFYIAKNSRPFIENGLKTCLADDQLVCDLKQLKRLPSCPEVTEQNYLDSFQMHLSFLWLMNVNNRTRTHLFYRFFHLVIKAQTIEIQNPAFTKLKCHLLSIFTNHNALMHQFKYKYSGKYSTNDLIRRICDNSGELFAELLKNGFECSYLLLKEILDEKFIGEIANKRVSEYEVQERFHFLEELDTFYIPDNKAFVLNLWIYLQTHSQEDPSHNHTLNLFSPENQQKLLSMDLF